MTWVYVCVDLDGTLLDSEGKLPVAHVVVLGRLLAECNGGLVVMTARNPYDVARLFGGVPFSVEAWCSDGACRATVAGGRIKQIWHEIHLPSDVAVATVHDLLGDVDGPEPLVFTGARNCFQILACSSRADASRRLLASLGDERPFTELGDAEQLRSVAGLLAVRAVSVIDETPVAERVLRRLPRREGGQLHFYAEHRIPGHSWIDVIGASVSKGASARVLRAEAPGVLIVAAGNGSNDVSLIEEADWAVCPADAEGEVLSRATVVLAGGCGIGVIEALRKYLADLVEATL